MLSLLIASLVAAPNVVLISVDTLRADHLGFYGSPYATSPNLDQLAERSLVFDDMICEIPLTGPSMVSMMTSRIPRSIGVVRNGMPLPEDIPTVPEMFSAAGYETMCVTSNWTLKDKLAGLAKGFDLYDDEFNEKRWGMFKSERDAKDVTRLAQEALENWDSAAPLFAWFHFSDPHAPYVLRSGFTVSSRDDRPGDRGAKMKVRYDSEIAYTDSWIATLLRSIPSENTYVVFVGDHGESLGEHGFVGHGRRIYQKGLHIPFMVSGPGVTPGRNSASGRGIDVGATLLGLAGLDALPAMDGIDLLKGAIPEQRVRVIETYGGAVQNVPGVKEIMTNRGPDAQGALHDGWKLIVDGRREELFRLSDDPEELNNLAKQEPERVEELKRLIDVWNEKTTRTMSDDAELSDEDVEALRSLGYID